jgi:hypothetical protein
MRHSRGFAAALSALAVVGVAAGCGGHSNKSSGSSVPNAPGRILGYDDSKSQLLTESLAVTQRTLIPGSVSAAPNTSADNKYLVTYNGDGMFKVTATGVQKVHSPVMLTTNSDRSIPGQPFLDHNRYILAPTNGSKNGLVKAVPLHGGKSVVLGRADDETGDPTAVAAYATIAKGPQVTDFSEESAQLQPDGSIVRMTVGHAPHTLMTAKTFEQLGGLPSNSELLMYAEPSPDGRQVLVSANPINAANPRTVYVVIKPDGTMGAKLVGAHLTGGYWSNDGSKIAFFNNANQLVIWQPSTNVSTTVPLPRQSSGWYSCIWSPDNNWFGCAGGHAVVRGDPTTRLLVDLATKKTATVPTGDYPVVWLTGS